MKAVADALFAASSTRAKTAKVAALAGALADVARREPARLAFVARFLTGTLLPTDDERVLGIGGALVFEAVCAVTGVAAAEVGRLARAAGDLGTAAGEAMRVRREREAEAGAPSPPGLALAAAERLAAELAGRGARADKLRALVAALDVCSALEAQYVVRAFLGEMRVGAREGLVEEAIAKAFGRPLADVRRAAGLVADVGLVTALAHEDRLAEARVVLGRPLGFMLATPIEVARGADLAAPMTIEDKIDGIRAQAHVSADGVRLFARGKGAVTTAFPDVTAPIAAAARAGTLASAILDGEIVVVDDRAAAAAARPRPFSALQPRLKKTVPDDDLVRDHPVQYLVYDLLFEDGEEILALPFADRRARLERWAEGAPPPLVVHASRPLVAPLPGSPAEDPAARRTAIDAVLDAEYDAARSRGFEGLVLKRLDAPYAAGVRGFAWLKVKKALATLDVVVVAAERGHGRRAGVLSDYTFSVRDGEELRTIGKAYSGLTDVEIAALTGRLRGLALAEEQRGYLAVRPEIVLEVAFDGLQRSDRHSSGFALRFPRIARIRDDKSAAEIDTLAAVEKLWEAQLASGHREDPAERAPKKKGRKSGRRPDVRKSSKQLKLFDDD
jgi:DNA ligase-1